MTGGFATHCTALKRQLTELGQNSMLQRDVTNFYVVIYPLHVKNEARFCTEAANACAVIKRSSQSQETEMHVASASALKARCDNLLISSPPRPFLGLQLSAKPRTRTIYACRISFVPSTRATRCSLATKNAVWRVKLS